MVKRWLIFRGLGNKFSAMSLAEDIAFLNINTQHPFWETLFGSGYGSCDTNHGGQCGE